MRLFFLLLATCICIGLGYVSLMLYTHTDPWSIVPWERGSVPAAAQPTPTP